MVACEDIRRARMELAESQVKFGARFGVSQTAVHRWETRGLPERGAARIAVESFLRSLENNVV